MSENLTTILNGIIDELTGPSPSLPFEGDMIKICEAVTKTFLGEPSLLHLKPPLRICGDIHGQFTDLLQIMTSAEMPPDQKYLFLGDYVDRGQQSCEVICLLLALKLRYPTAVYLLRGNHETVEMTTEYGFKMECCRRMGRNVYSHFITTFNAMPLAAVVGERLFCVHGGITPELNSLDQIAAIERPLVIEEAGMIADLVWSDPSDRVTEFGKSDRGNSCVWGYSPARQFMEANNLTHIIRAHQMAMNGVEYPFNPDRSIITVFSAPYYAGEFKNRGAFLVVDENLDISAEIITCQVKCGKKVTRVPQVKKKGSKKKGKKNR